jgi:peptidyl-Lys metalloendopeptidase
MMSERETWAVSLEVNSSAQGVLAIVTFSNNSSAPAALYKWNACFDNRIHNDVFEIMLESGSVSYTGRLVKRGEPKADDFLTVEPGQSVSFKVDLKAAYGFPAGKHRYRIRYSALNPYLGRPGFDALKSNPTSFDYSN